MVKSSYNIDYQLNNFSDFFTVSFLNFVPGKNAVKP